MSFMNRMLAKTYKYPRAMTHDVAVEKDMKIPMPDGAVLLANRYYPRLPGKRPTFVFSTVYYERMKGLQAGPIAEQGFNVLVVSSRGSFGSTGEYSPFLSERADAKWIIEWLKKQDWFNGEICAGGFSYTSYSGWAIAEQAGPMLKVISTKCAGSNFRDMLYSGDALFLEVFLFWMDSSYAQQKSTIDRLKVLSGNDRRRELALHLPLAELE